MIKPPVMTCDGCKCEIPEGKVFAKLSLPIPPELHARMVAHVEASMSGRFRGSPFAGMFGGEAMVPTTWALELCVGCAYGLFPGAAQEVEDQIVASLDSRVAAKRRAEESRSDLRLERED